MFFLFLKLFFIFKLLLKKVPILRGGGKQGNERETKKEREKK